jgi:1-acyl-sn-glycerol-3-phosphate acyltransferase
MATTSGHDAGADRPGTDPADGGTPEGRGKAAQARKSTLAAGAARATGERAKRRHTPLLAATVVPPFPTPAAAQSPPRAGDPTRKSVPDRDAAAGPSGAGQSGAGPTASATTSGEPTAAQTTGREPEEAAPAVAKHRPRPVAKAVPTGKALSRTGARSARPPRTARSPRAEGRPAAARHPSELPERTLKAVPDDQGDALGDAAPVPGERRGATIVPGMEELLAAGIAAVRTVAEAGGLSPEEVERHLASLLSFLRRRVTGDYVVDDFGFDEDFTEHFYLPVLRPLYRSWFRVEVRGVENIPATGGGLVVANHSGTIAMDSLMTQVAVHDEHPAHRHLRMLGADLVFQTPVVGQVARKSGSTLAANPDAERLLSTGELCGVWPEGFKGVGKPFSERYKLQRFGRGGFVAAALRTGVPIIPCSIVGAEEIYPIIGNMKTVARLVGAPYAPITPTWPWLGPLGLIPLPSKWIIEFGVPVETADLGPAAADDPMLVFDLTDQVRETIQQTLYSLLMQRRSVFF